MRWLAQMTPRWMACHSSLPLLFIAALDLLYWHICFFLIFFFLLIIKIFLTSGTRDRAGVSASLEAHHWKLAWVSTICHETKQASLSNLYNINNSMPHFDTCAGGPQYCRGFWGGGVWPFFVIFGSLIVFLIHLVRCRRLRGTWENATGLLAGKSTAIRPIARANRCSAVTLHNT